MNLRRSLLAAALAAPLALVLAHASAQANSLTIADGAAVHDVQFQFQWDDDDDDYVDRRRGRGRDEWREERRRERWGDRRGGRFDCNQHRCIDQRTGDLWHSICDRGGCRPTTFARPAGRW